MDSFYVPIVVGNKCCNAMLDSGSTVSLIDQCLLEGSSGVILNSVKQCLVTASGNRMDSMGEVEFEVKIGRLCCSQKFVVVSSLVENCILGVDFLVQHRVTLDFSTKSVTGPEPGVVKANKKLQLPSTMLCHSHRNLEQYPDMYAVINGVEEIKDQEEEFEYCGAVPDYVRSPSKDIPECDTEFSDIVEMYKDLFSSIPGVVKVEEFRIRTDNSTPVKIPPRLIPQASIKKFMHKSKKCAKGILSEFQIAHGLRLR